MSEKTTLEITEISDKNLIRMLIDKQKSNGNMKFCFLIGSGASRSSGIATGGTLAQDWYKEIKSDTEEDKFEEWKKKEGIDEKDLATSYSAIYKERFQNCPESGYEALIKIMEGKSPSIGYIILAKIIADEGHNVVITTNFDNLLEDAIRTYTEKKPFIAGHERLADYVPKRSDRPIIVKVHRDLYLQPKSDTEETSELSEQWKSVLDDILSNYYLIVIGYGGNDGSLMKYLKTKKEEKKGNFRRKNIYWCLMERETVPTKISNVLDQDDRIVRIKGFEELMYQCYVRLGFDFLDDIEKIDPTPPHKLLTASYERIASLQKQRKELAEKLEKREKEEESNQISDSDTLIYLFRIGIENDLDKKYALFEEVIQKHPNDFELLSQYAIFLHSTCKDYDKAEEYYKKAIEIDEKNPNILGGYAIFLKDIRKDYDKAEQYYKKAIEIDEKKPNILGSYAIFLENIRKDYDKAEEYYKKAIEADGKHPDNLGNYAIFLDDIRKDYDKAEQYYKKAIEADGKDPNILGNYAHLLIVNKEDLVSAKHYIQEAFDYISNVTDKETYSPILAELWFYRYAHYYEEHGVEAEKELTRLLDAGVKSPGWDLAKDIEMAKKNNHPHIEKVEEFAKRLTEPEA